MPTLANIQGGSLTPNLSQALQTAMGAFGTKRQRDVEQRTIDAEQRKIDEAATQKAQIAEQLQVLLPDPTADPAKKRGDEEAALLRLGAIHPAIAKSARDTIAAGDVQAQELLRTEAEKGARNAAFVMKQPDFASKQKALGALGRDAAARGEPLDRFIELQNMSEDQLGLEMQRMQIAAQDIKTVLKPQETFTAVLDAEGNVIAQKSSTTGRVVADPRSTASKPGMASAVTKVYGNGTVVQALPSGKTSVKDPEGNEVTGDARIRTLQAAQKAELTFERTKAGAKAAGAQAIAKSGEAFDSIGKIKPSIANIDTAIKLLDEGAGSGPVMSKLPSIRSASIQLDNVQKSMGLDVVASTTFGALAKGELELALSKALPTNLAPDDLRQWLVEKKDAQEKLAGYLEDVALFLGTEGNTVAGWIQAQRDLQPQDAVIKDVVAGPQEGTTATNPSTGESIIFRGGQWQAL